MFIQCLCVMLSCQLNKGRHARTPKLGPLFQWHVEVERVHFRVCRKQVTVATHIVFSTRTDHVLVVDEHVVWIEHLNECVNTHVKSQLQSGGVSVSCKWMEEGVPESWQCGQIGAQLGICNGPEHIDQCMHRNWPGCRSSWHRSCLKDT